MPDADGELLATALLGALPPPLAESILGRLGPVAERLRVQLPAATRTPEILDRALDEFFDVHRILERGYLATRLRPTGDATAPADAEPVAPPREDPIQELRKLSVDRLLVALEGEPPAAIAHTLGCLDPGTAGLVLKGLPQDIRAEVAVRYSRPGARNFSLVNAIAKVVAEKGNALSVQPDAKPTDRIADLAAMFRGLPRPERIALLQKIGVRDADLASQLRAKLFRFTDLIKIEDRPLQQLLSQLNLRNVAIAMKGADAAFSEKILRNISARARDQLTEEVETLGNLPQARITEAQDEIVTLLRQFEEEGKITLED